MSLGQSSASSILRGSRPSDSQHNLHVPDYKRQSADDGESSRGVVYSGSSTHSGEVLRRAKSSIFSKLKTRTSKTHLRADSDDSEHPSLRPPVPPLPEQQKFNSLFGVVASVTSSPTIGIPPAPKRDKRDKGKKKASASKVPPTPPPKDDFSSGQEFTGDLNLDSMEGIVDFSVVASANGFPKDPSSPSSGFDSSHSYSDHSPLPSHPFNHLPHTQFSDPFSSTSLSDKRKGILQSGDSRRVSPKTAIPPVNKAPLASSSSLSGPGSPTWVPPESWAVDKPTEDLTNSILNGDLSEHESGSEASVEGVYPGPGKFKDDKSIVGRRKNPVAVSFSSSLTNISTSTARKVSRPTLRGMPTHPPPSFSYKMRVYRQNGEYHVVAMTLNSTVQEVCQKLRKKHKPVDEHIQHNLYLKEQGRGELNFSCLEAVFVALYGSMAMLTPFLLDWQNEC